MRRGPGARDRARPLLRATPPHNAAAASASPVQVAVKEAAWEDEQDEDWPRRLSPPPWLAPPPQDEDPRIANARRAVGGVVLGGFGAVGLGTVVGVPGTGLVLVSSAAAASAVAIAKAACAPPSSGNTEESGAPAGVAELEELFARAANAATWRPAAEAPPSNEGISSVAYVDADADGAVGAPPVPWLDVEAPLQLAVGRAGFPRADKAEAGLPGEDASDDTRAGPRWRREHWLGVCDGVSAWSSHEAGAVDAGAYARELLASTLAFAREPEAAAAAAGTAHAMASEAKACGASPEAALAFGHMVTELPGSSTACVARVLLGDEDAWERRAGGVRPPTSAMLSAVNVGDSGFVVVRRGKIVYNCPTVSHTFNCPLQLGCDTHYPQTDGVDDGASVEVTLERGDVVVMGSDGLFDNMFASEIARVVSDAVAVDGSLLDAPDYAGAADARAQLAADKLAHRARVLSVDPAYVSPFGVRYQQHLAEERGVLGRLLRFVLRRGDDSYAGGKPDDVSVVVAVLA